MAEWKTRENMGGSVCVLCMQVVVVYESTKRRAFPIWCVTIDYAEMLTHVYWCFCIIIFLFYTILIILILFPCSPGLRPWEVWY